MPSPTISHFALLDYRIVSANKIASRVYARSFAAAGAATYYRLHYFRLHRSLKLSQERDMPHAGYDMILWPLLLHAQRAVAFSSPWGFY